MHWYVSNVLLKTSAESENITNIIIYSEPNKLKMMGNGKRNALGKATKLRIEPFLWFCSSSLFRKKNKYAINWVEETKINCKTITAEMTVEFKDWFGNKNANKINGGERINKSIKDNDRRIFSL